MAKHNKTAEERCRRVTISMPVGLYSRAVTEHDGPNLSKYIQGLIKADLDHKKKIATCEGDDILEA